MTNNCDSEKWYSVKVWITANGDVSASSKEEVERWIEDELDKTAFDWEITMQEVEEYND